MNQTSGSGSGTWKSLGTWTFNAGTTHKIVLGDVASKVVVADAVRLTKTATDVKTVNQSNVWHSFSVRSTVQAWLNGTQPNHGFMLKASDETLNRGGPRYEAAEYAYEGETRNTPKLLLTYGRPGATLNPPTTVRATGADLTWGAYLDPSAAIGGQPGRVPGCTAAYGRTSCPRRRRWSRRSLPGGRATPTRARRPPRQTRRSWARRTSTEHPGGGPTSDQLGLEKFYQYAGRDAGTGMNVLVNEFSGNAVVGYNAFVNPGRGLATSLRVTYNSQDTSKSFLGYGWSLSALSISRLGTPVQFRGNNQWPQQVDYTDGDGTTHVFELNKHGSTDETLGTYDQPAGVHLHLQRTNTGDPIREWVLTRPDRTQVFLDGQGYQTAMRDRNGNELLFTYERKQVNRNSGVLRYVTDAASRQTLTLDYYGKGDSYTYYSGDTRLTDTNLTNGLITDQLKSVTDISNRTLLFIYSDKGLLREVDDGSATTRASWEGRRLS